MKIQERYDYHIHRALHSILEISLEAISLKEQLQSILNLILDLPWLGIDPHGSIHLTENNSKELIMKVQKGLSDKRLRICRKIPFGYCLCGQAALTKKMIFKNCIDDCHDVRYPGIPPHGHYCVPILSKGRVLGVINMYIKENHKKTKLEEDFLSATANTLAGIIERKRAEEDLQKINEELEQKVNERTRELRQSNQTLQQEVCYRKEAEKQSRQAVEEWEATFNSIEDLIAIQSADFKLLRVNKAYADLFQTTPEALTGKHCYEIVHQTQCHHTLCPHAKTIEKQETVVETIFEPRLNSYLETTTSPLLNDNGKCLGTVHIAKNITEKKLAEQQLQESEARLSCTLNSIGDGVITTDLSGKIVRMNPTAEELTGWRFNEAKGNMIKNIFSVIDDASHQPILNLVEQVLRLGTTISLSNQTLLKRKDGTELFIDESGAPILNTEGNVIGVVFAFRDITEQKRLTLMKEQFLQTISHELRTPLTSIIGYQDLLLSGIQGELTDPQKKNLQIAMGNSEQLLALITDLLDLNKLEAGEMPVTLSPIKIVLELAQLVENFSAQAQIKGIALQLESSLDPDTEVISDKKKIKMIVSNLLGNALKFTERGKVSLLLNQQSDRYQIIVQDTGIGIPFDAQDYIFEKFRQVDNGSSRKADGTGLGLSITRKMAELIGGTICVQSDENQGSTFIVELPAHL